VLRQVVDSSSLRSIGYDRRTQTLEVEFKNGGIYQYGGVSAEVWNQLRRAASIGRFFQTHVRDRFPATRVS
jgi:hypothetical protein